MSDESSAAQYRAGGWPKTSLYGETWEDIFRNEPPQDRMQLQ